MKFEYDKDADAAYIYVSDPEKITTPCVAKTVACDSSKVGGIIHLDFDHDNKLFGIEILNAKSLLPGDLFE